MIANVNFELLCDVNLVIPFFFVAHVGNHPLSQPHFEGSVRSPLTLSKMGLESPLGLLKTQSLIAGVKAPQDEVFFIPLKIS
jgi:hypothetical protein